MRITTFSLRDMFWLTLIVAVGAGWAVERSQVIGRLRDLNMNPGVPPNDLPRQPSNPQLIVARLQGLSRETLLKELKRSVDAPVFDMHLLEAVRRGWKNELALGYFELMHPPKQPQGEWKRLGFPAPFPPPNPHTILNGEYLTALRRAEGKPTL